MHQALSSPDLAHATREAASDVPARSTMSWLLRAEGAVLLGAAATLYPLTGHGWGLFFALFLVPDLSLLGYFGGPRIGAAVYNTGHHLAIPGVLALIGVVTGGAVWLAFALVWTAHIGFDRTLGFGLKYASGFRDTHLGHI
jgi:hypothetical protein